MLPLVERGCTAQNELQMCAVRYMVTRHDVTYSVRGVRFFIFSPILLVHYHYHVHTPEFDANTVTTVPFVFIAASFECRGRAHLYGLGRVYNNNYNTWHLSMTQSHLKCMVVHDPRMARHVLQVVLMVFPLYTVQPNFNQK